jgi:hypothetical protein
LLKQLTKTVLETALNEEMTEHLGYEKHDPAGTGTGNIRNGTRAKTVLTDTTGAVEIEVPRDRAATFEPQIVRKRQHRLSGVDEVGLSQYAKGCPPAATLSWTGYPSNITKGAVALGDWRTQCVTVTKCPVPKGIWLYLCSAAYSSLRGSVLRGSAGSSLCPAIRRGEVLSGHDDALSVRGLRRTGSRRPPWRFVMDNRDYPLSSAAAQDVLLDKQAPASDKRHCTRIPLGRTRSRLSRRDDDLPACAPQLPRAEL